MNKQKIELAWWLLYLMFGFFLILAGIDKYFNFLVDWQIYLNEYIPQYLNLSTTSFMHALGISEILIGLLIFFKPKIGGYLIMLLFSVIAINLLSMGSHHHEGYGQSMVHYDVALHDIAMAVTAYVFILLTQALNKLRN